MSPHKSKSQTIFLIGGFVFFVIFIVAASSLINKKKQSTSGIIQVVAAENFWGSLVSQLGGSYIHVTSIVSDPNGDPHEYSSNANNARAFARANYVILNGAGYDSWGNKLINANPSGNRKVLIVADLLGKKVGDNPHFWYSPMYVEQAVYQIQHDLILIDPPHASYYQQQYKTLQSTFTVEQQQINTIKQNYYGTHVAATEDVFTYLADATGLTVISPPTFTQAVAEGNDPPTESIVQYQRQLRSGQVKLLVYNTQTVTPLTDNIKKLAAQQNIPIVGVSETIQPPTASYQDWMNNQLTLIKNALSKNSQRK